MITTINDNKRVGLIWATIAVFAGIAILLGVMLPDTFKFWGCVGVFLTGVGIISFIIDHIMKKAGSHWVSIIVTIIGVILIVVNVICPTIGSIGIILGAVALIIVGIMAGINIARRKN